MQRSSKEFRVACELVRKLRAVVEGQVARGAKNRRAAVKHEEVDARALDDPRGGRVEPGGDREHGRREPDGERDAKDREQDAPAPAAQEAECPHPEGLKPARRYFQLSKRCAFARAPPRAPKLV